jgi:hypothetical protein
MTSKFIDITPTWQGLLPALLAVIEHGNAQGRAMARVELSRMAEAADLYNEGLSAPPAHIPGDWTDAKPEPETIDDRYQIYCANVPNPVSYDDWLNR